MADLIGKSLGRYHILEQLGEGGMATVYKAYDTRLERDVAVKVLRTELFGQAILERILKRFEREAKSLAKLSHPNIVKVHDYGEHEGKPYLVMEYLAGGTVKQLLGKPMPWQDAVRLLLPMAEALAYAHENGILHRDVKPSNILLTDKGQPMLTDFGIAKILGLEDTQTLTATGVGIGTPEYMSPEQGLGKAVDAGTDVYSLGIVLYELITGRKPYIADTPMAVVVKHLNDPLPRPGQYVKDLLEAVEKVLLKSLAKNPEDRFPDMAALLEAMKDLLAIGSPVVRATPPLSQVKAAPKEDTEATIAQEDTYATEYREERREEPAPVTSKKVIPEEKLPQTILAPKPAPRDKVGAGRDKWLPWVAALSGIGILIMIVVQATSGNGRVTAVVTPSHTPTVNHNSVTSPISLPVVLSGTPVSLPNIPISLQNANQIIQLARWGKGLIWQLVYSPDGQYLAMATSLGIYLYDAESMQEVRLIESDTPIWSVVFSPDGEIIFGSSEHMVRLWRVTDGYPLETITLEDYISQLAISPDGDTLAIKSNSNNGIVWLWGISHRELLLTLEGNIDLYAECIAFSPDGVTISVGYNDGTVKLWRISDGSLLQTLKGHEAGVETVAYSPDGSILASGSQDRTIRLWRVSDGSLQRVLKQTSYVWSIAFSPDGVTLASGSWDHNVWIWRIMDGSVLRILEGHTDSVGNVAFSPDGETIASESGDGAVKKWRISDGILLSSLEGFMGYVSSVAFSPDGRILASVSEGKAVRLWRVSDGTILHTLEDSAGLGFVSRVAFSPDGEVLATGSWDGIVRLWRVSDGVLLRMFEGHTDTVNGVAFSSDGETMASCSSDGTVRLWHIPDGTLLHVLEEETASVAFSPDGKILASSSDKVVRLWRISNWTLLQSLEGYAEAVNFLAFSPDGEILVSASWWGDPARLWNVSEGTLFRVLDEKTSYATSVVFSPQGEIVALGSQRNFLWLGQVSDGSQLYTLGGHTDMVKSVAFSPDGLIMASGSYDGTIRLWGVP